MGDQDDNATADKDLFRKAMAEVNRNHRKYCEAQPIPHQTIPKPPMKIGRPNSVAAAAPNSAVMSDQTHGDYLEFARGGLQKRVLQRLKHADFSITATLDLHGYTTAEAEPLLTQFLQRATQQSNAFVLIIHGKGLHSPGFGGVLKQFTANWLKQQPAVKAFCSARPKDGGTGAVYVLLRVGNRR